MRGGAFAAASRQVVASMEGRGEWPEAADRGACVPVRWVGGGPCVRA